MRYARLSFCALLLAFPVLAAPLAKGYGTAAGVVVNGAGRPVAGARVTLISVKPSPYSGQRTVVYVPHHTTAGGDGRFSLADLSDGHYELVARAAGFAPTLVKGLSLTGSSGQSDLGTIVLKPGVRQSGVVVDRQDRPLAGVVVKLWQELTEYAAGPAPPRPADQEARTGADGRFTLPDLAPGVKSSLVAEQPGFLSGDPLLVSSPGEGEIRFVLATAARLSGRMVDESGNPVRGTVIVIPVRARNLYPQDIRGAMRFTKSDEAGHFSLVDLEEGPADVSAKVDGHFVEPRVVELVAGEEVKGVELVLRPAR